MIVFDHVTKRYDDGTVAVDDLNLTCADGEITVLVGSSGCGKTTSLRMINRLVDPTSGTISLNGQDVTKMDPADLRRGIGYVIQHGGLFPHKSVVDNIATVPRLLGTPKAEARTRARELMDLVGLEERMANRYPFQLSGGQQQRVGVARALAADPPVMLMDEPFSAVDPVVRQELQGELIRLHAELKKTIVFVTHDIDEAVKLGDRVAVMQVGGHLVQFDAPEKVLAEPANDFVRSFLGSDRGIKWLSFFPSATLDLSPANAVKIGQDAGPGWSLVVDDAGRAEGWFDGGNGSRVSEEKVVHLGHTFDPAADSLRAALDAAVLAPCGLAVAAGPDGKVLGVVPQDEIAARIRQHGRAE